MSKPWRTPQVYEQTLLVPPSICAIDLRCWVTPGLETTQVSTKVWEPLDDELLALVVYPEKRGRSIQDLRRAIDDELLRMLGLYCEPFA